MSEEAAVDNGALLRQHGLQVTAQRLAVLRAVSERSHSTADDIDKLVRAEIGAISRQAVYDALAGLHRQGRPPTHPAGGLVGPLRDPGGRQPPPRDLSFVQPDRRRRLCRRRDPLPDRADASGYEIDEAEVTFWGRCPECVAKT